MQLTLEVKNISCGVDFFWDAIALIGPRLPRYWGL
jgi:hypothetical protein